MSKKETEITKTKHAGQVFTPNFIVEAMLDYCGYRGELVLGKHVIDNSCGDGAFLKVIVRTYILSAKIQGLDKEEIKKHLATFVHGVDNDKEAYLSCRENLCNVAAEYGIDNVEWDLRYDNALLLHDFDGRMDYVVGNPPYVRVHNLDASYEEVKRFKFANGGMTDLYLAFFELGFRMLNAGGQLCYITPSSWLNSLAAYNMRQHILSHGMLVSLTDLGHFQAFENVTVYTLISHFSKKHTENQFAYYIYNGSICERTFVANLTLGNVHINGYFYLGNLAQLDLVRKVKSARIPRYVSVKNGFATLADPIFIGNNVPQSPFTIKAIKASTGKWQKCLFPYSKAGKPLPENEVFANSDIKVYFEANKEKLLKGRTEFPGWYLFGRAQALADVWRPKLAVNTLVRNVHDFKLNELAAGEGIYSGLYVITDCNISFEQIKGIIASDDFVEYVKMMRKYKSGGYYTFNSKDIEQFINYQISITDGKKYRLKQSVSYSYPDLFQ